MEHTGSMTLDATPADAVTERDNLGESISFPFVQRPGERGSEARRRFLFAAAHQSKSEEASLGNFPGKLAWISVALFILGVLIALAG